MNRVAVGVPSSTRPNELLLRRGARREGEVDRSDGWGGVVPSVRGGDRGRVNTDR